MKPETQTDEQLALTIASQTTYQDGKWKDPDAVMKTADKYYEWLQKKKVK